jgi:hypothetical protein
MTLMCFRARLQLSHLLSSLNMPLNGTAADCLSRCETSHLALSFGHIVEAHYPSQQLAGYLTTPQFSGNVFAKLLMASRLAEP